MTSLYKRYIPPKAAAPPSPSIVQVAAAPQPIAAPDPPKRKRERSEEEVAERKAKKAKKKGIPVEDGVKVVPAQAKAKAIVKPAKPSVSGSAVPELQPEPVVEDVVPEVLEAGTVPLPDVDAVEEAAATGDFSHVKNKKKRHKLEKEARKAKKAAAAGKGGEGAKEGEGEMEKVQGNVSDDEKKVETEMLEQVDDQTVGEVEVEDEDEDDVMGEADNEVAAEVPVQEEPIEVEVRTKKSTKSKKKGAVVEDANDVEEGEDTPPAAENTPPAAEDTTYDDTKSQPKKRRHRLESVLTKTSSPPDEDDAHLRKHGAILNNFQKASKRSQALQSQAKDVEPTEVEFSQPTVQDLEMPDADLPPPYDDDDDDEEEVTSNLPSWLAKPTVISADSKATFVSLNLAPKTLAHLSALKFDDALPVQQALIPLLLPAGTPGSSFKTGTEMILPDLAVSAATGSGKTLAYLLPVIESLKVHSIRGRLTALVVVPTRELVQQVAAVAESLSKGSGLRVGMATGSGKFVDEQRKLVKSGFQYAPNSSEADDDEVNITECINEDYLACPPNHKVTHESALDILIATPGRLLEHLEHTKGFNLVHLQWFILDEADKLLDHQSAGEISSLLQHISRPRTAEEQDARERYLRQQGEWDERAERRVRKVLLSATMTRDVQRLTGLGLRFPKLIAVQQEVEEKKSGFEVPEGLREYVVPVGDGSEKPLVALEWLRTMIFGEKEERDEDEDSSDTDSDSSDSDSDSDSDSESGSDSPSSSSTVGHEDDVPAPAKKTPPTVLVFTATSESASRLSHLLRALKPAWEKNIHLLIKSHKNLPRFTSSSVPLIVVSTDRAARGLDSLSGRPISHVLQYDVPTSLTGYVHRVGRTARNGRDGEGWTLYARREAGWFLKAVGVETGGEGEGVKRRGLVERVKVFMKDDSIRERYAEVLGEMRGEVLGGGKAE